MSQTKKETTLKCPRCESWLSLITEKIKKKDGREGKRDISYLRCDNEKCNHVIGKTNE